MVEETARVGLVSALRQLQVSEVSRPMETVSLSTPVPLPVAWAALVPAAVPPRKSCSVSRPQLRDAPAHPSSAYLVDAALAAVTVVGPSPAKAGSTRPLV